MSVKSPIICLDINLTGVNLTTSAASVNSALPVNTAGVAARYVRISATANARVRVGPVGSTALATDTLVMPGESVIMNCQGATTVAAIQDTAAGVVNVVPIEWA